MEDIDFRRDLHLYSYNGKNLKGLNSKNSNSNSNIVLYSYFGNLDELKNVNINVLYLSNYFKDVDDLNKIITKNNKTLFNCITIYLQIELFKTKLLNNEFENIKIIGNSLEYYSNSIGFDNSFINILKSLLLLRPEINDKYLPKFLQDESKKQLGL
jgi:hypothetical protein